MKEDGGLKASLKGGRRNKFLLTKKPAEPV